MTARSEIDGNKVKYTNGAWVPENGSEMAIFPNGARFHSCLGGPEIELHCSNNYSGIATLRHPDGREEDFFWNGSQYDGHGMECNAPAENQCGDDQLPTTEQSKK